MSDVVDVVVIGAGLSGLQAALDVHEAGRSVTILEARDRVGGKTRSEVRPDGKGIQEIGAAWINDTNQSHIWDYCKRFGLTAVVQDIQGSVASEDAEGNCHFFPYGELPRFAQSEVDSIQAIRDQFEAASLDPETFKQPKRGELDRITLEQWCRNAGATDLALKTAAVWCRGTLGQDPCEVSALAFLEIARGALGIVNLRHDGKHGAQHLRLQEGTQSIAIGMAKLLPPGTIKLSSPVSSLVRVSSKLCLVRTANGQQIKARKVILSIPGPSYKNIAFDPPLPPRKFIYTTAVRFGCYVKYICLFKTPFWRDLGACGLAQSFRGPLNHCRDTSVDALGNYALTCFLASEPGRRWFALSEDDRREAIVKQLGALFSVGYEKVQSELLGTITTEWMQDKWAGWGCPFPAPPPSTIGAGEDGDWLWEKAGNIYFVGTELTNEWRGYMEGALRSGKRGSRQVLADLLLDASSL
ncbi:hypothetical protein A1O3_02465 [Capronia epimyces CBS 606.96]|uniref:Amine oxidase n=1 Tax=Capronia epimyces CBS 606.96 TaxID=1182542 RepID=W9YA83_9EURO|nr:uncharacterized protein A1O3_02465 [Capronia epimyces CBS 606.96]EXJ89398.1 hypothetical protein A1O3_02465 [Capronia epimyces CBS 606.96]